MILPARKLSRKIPAGGFVPDATIIRGQNWVWGDQDGKLTYNVCSVEYGDIMYK